MTTEWKWIPIEPTEEMINAAYGGIAGNDESIREIYRAFIAASPKPDCGNKILAGLRDAVAGNFAAVTIEGQDWRRVAASPPAPSPYLSAPPQPSGGTPEYFYDPDNWEHTYHWFYRDDGKHVACFCELNKPCHGDVWLELANEEPVSASSKNTGNVVKQNSSGERKVKKLTAAAKREIADFVSEMLLKCDIDVMLEFHQKYNPTSPPFPNRTIAEISLHKARTGARSLPDDERLRSFWWLTERGYSSMDDSELSHLAARRKALKGE